MKTLKTEIACFREAYTYICEVCGFSSSAMSTVARHEIEHKAEGLRMKETDKYGTAVYCRNAEEFAKANNYFRAKWRRFTNALFSEPGWFFFEEDDEDEGSMFLICRSQNAVLADIDGRIADTCKERNEIASFANLEE